MTTIKKIYIALGLVAALSMGATTAKADPIIMNSAVYQTQLPSNYGGSGPIIMNPGIYSGSTNPIIIPDIGNTSTQGGYVNTSSPIASQVIVTSNNVPLQANLSATTVGTNTVAVSTARLVGTWSISNGSQVATWFEYGPTTNTMNTVTATEYQNASNGTFAQTISGLSPHTTYYYRTVAQSNGVFAYGAVKAFTTGATTVVTQVLGTTTTVRNVSTLANNNTAIATEAQNTNICSADKVNYTLTYSNSTDNTITNAMLVVQMPVEVDYAQSTAQANYNSNARTVTVFIGTLAKGQTGVVYLSGTANSKANGTQSIATRADFTFTKADGTNATTTNYIMYTGANCGNNLAGSAIGAGFLPTSFAGWVLLIILICAVVYIVRKYFTKKEDAHGAGVHH